MRKLMILFLIFGLLAMAIVPAFAQDPEETPEMEDEDIDEIMEFEVDEDLGSEDNPIVVLFVPSEDAEEIQSGVDELVALIVEETGFSIEASVATDYAAAIEAMCGAEAHFGALATFSYILASARGCADVGLVSVRFGSPFYQGQVVTRADTGIEDYADLAGTVFCRPDPLSTSGWIIPSIAMQANGVDLDSLEVVEAGGHDGTITAVYNGECDAGATFVDARSSVEDDLPDVNDVVIVIAESPEIPNDALAFSPVMSEETREAFTEALLAIAEDEDNAELLNEVYNWNSLTEADDTFFDDFRQSLDAAGIDVEDLQ
jgi:phosphonate transport system substrate-binding protein